MREADISFWRRARRRFYWLLTVVFLRMADRLPIETGRLLGARLARLATGFRPRERRVAIANLDRVFPELDADRRKRLLAEAVTALGYNLFDTLAAGRLLATDGQVREENPGVGEALSEMAAQGRGVFILTGHFGCWELLGGYLARELKRRGFDGLGVVTGTVHNPAVDKLLQDRRRSLGMIVLPREQGAAPLLRYLRDGGVVAVLQDQHTRVQNLEVPFFGVPAPTPVGLARLALRHDIPVLPVAIARNPIDGRHVVIRRPPLEFKRTGDHDDDIQGFLESCNRELEYFIRRNPAEWVWFHERWKQDSGIPAHH